MRTYTRKRRQKNDVIEDVHELCRLCLGKAEEAVPLFSGKEDMCSALPMRIMICLGQQISQEDGTPNAICTNCHQELERYYSFRKKCEESYIKLKAHVKALKCLNHIIKANEDRLSNEVETQHQNLQEQTQSDKLKKSVIADVYHIEEVEATTERQTDRNIENEDRLLNIHENLENQNIQEDSHIRENEDGALKIEENSQEYQEIQCHTRIEENRDRLLKNLLESHIKLDDSRTQADEMSQLVTANVHYVEEHSELQTPRDSKTPVLGPVDGNVKQDQEENVQEGTMIQLKQSNDMNPDISTFLSAILLELGVLQRTPQGLLARRLPTGFQLETGDGDQLHLQLMEEDDDELAEPVFPVYIESSVIKSKPGATVKTASPVSQSGPVSQSEIESQCDLLAQCDAVSQGDLVSQCDPAIVDEKSLLQIKQNKSGKKPRTHAWCSLCGRVFASGSAAQRHARVHSGARPYACPECGRTFAQKVVMERHRLVHMKSRPFACARCPKSFTQRGSLAAHARSHAAPGTHARALTLHACTHCDRMFLHASGLSRHMVTHSGHAFACATCHRLFNDKSSLLRHARTAHPAVDQ